jgi:hypothetical protein
MKTEGVKYRKLPGRTVSFFGGRSRLWLADDHLLEVNGMVLAERYRRFPLADIRAFVIEKTRTQAIAMWIYGGLIVVGGLVLSILIIGGMRDYERAQMSIMPLYWIFGSVAGVFVLVVLIGFLITLIRGASCRCSVQTTAGLCVLASPNRRRGAEQVLAILAPEIEAAQITIVR